MRIADEQLLKEFKETQELLSQFGIQLHGYEPGFTGWLNGAYLNFGHAEWGFIKPLLEELRKMKPNKKWNFVEVIPCAGEFDIDDAGITKDFKIDKCPLCGGVHYPGRVRNLSVLNVDWARLEHDPRYYEKTEWKAYCRKKKKHYTFVTCFKPKMVWKVNGIEI